MEILKTGYITTMNILIQFSTFTGLVVFTVLGTILCLFFVGLRDGRFSNERIKKKDLSYYNSKLKLYKILPWFLLSIIGLWFILAVIPSLNGSFIGFSYVIILLGAGLFTVAVELLLVNIGMYGYILGHNLAIKLPKKKSRLSNTTPNFVNITRDEREKEISRILSQLKKVKKA
ncbi:hypothetical protein HYG86_16505 [Alkalicella caledoniensis]|uniref:Uncharacterized protein n=1 Tax=Alkalicella caledoniensis TaxID=2731377 RepID=A0A7G9WC44_ALKCA|nr:hypothetical protein [Alkalicella caledoniensis]QNO16256.1 hypothetical protein HYG86_16505 [Alkalicella caledoniensis]